MMLLFLAILAFGPVVGYHYEAGYDHHYTYSSTTDTIGMHNITTVMKFRVHMINKTEEGTKLHRLAVDSFVQHSQSGQYADNPFKWDLTKSFLFEMEPDGRVQFIHYHPEEKDELVTLKKALVGTMAAKFVKSADDKWQYSSTESDHGGHLSHTYEAQRTDSGTVVKRFHQSAKDVLRTHHKEIHIDHSGNIRKVLAKDNITMRGDEPNKKRSPGTTPLHDKDIKVYTTGEFPSISATGHTQVHLTLKRKLSGSPQSAEDNLIRDTIVVKKKPPKKTTLNDVGEYINGLVKCVLSHENKYAPNRTVCVGNLTRAVLSLGEEDFLMFAQATLNTSCSSNDTKCLDKRYLVLDVISQAKSNVSQQVIVDHVLSINISVEEVRRCLIHSIAVKQPNQNLVQAVEHLCFGKDDKFHGDQNMTLTQKRACLTLGALSKHLKDSGYETEAERIVEKFERWLGVHNESEFNQIVKPREKRSVGRGISYRDRDSHVALKRTLLHSLGNAAHPRSLRHISSYLELNKANAELRRTAAHALRHFTCNESAAHLLRSTLFDAEDVVRQGAYEIYIEHPESQQLTREQEEAVLSQRYTYPVVSRVRRASLAEILKALSFHLGMPKFEWGKTIGSKKLGASFGLRMENFVDLQLEPFKGKFELKVDNLAYAEVNVGIIGKNFDIFRVSLCYKKKFGYNLNVLKDFGFDDIQNLATAFDRLYHKIIDPIVDAVKTVEELIEMVREETFVELVKIIINLFKHLPEIIVDIVNRVKETYRKLNDFDGFPLINKFKKLVNRITTFISDIKSDVMEFYHSIADAMTVTLPFVGQEMGEGFNLIKDSWKFWEHPMESIKGMEMALLKFKVAVGTFIEAKNRIMDACFFAKGRTPYWFHPGEEIHGIFNDLSVIMKETWEEFKVIKNITKKSWDKFKDLKATLKGSWEQLKDLKEEQFNGFKDIIRGSWEEFNDLKEKKISEIRKILKGSWEELKDLTEEGYNNLQEIIERPLEEFNEWMNITKGSWEEYQDLNNQPADLSNAVAITDGFDVGGTRNSIKLLIDEAVEVLRERLKGTLDIAAPFWNKITHLMDLFKKIKNAYMFLRDVIHKGKYYMQKLFGSKFHRNFPKIPAPCESEVCGCGEYPRKDDKGRLGLHVNFKRKYKKLVNPFHGTVHRLSDKEVLIRPIRADVLMYEIVVSGFDVDRRLDEENKGVFKRAGKPLGSAIDASDCEAGNFVFVAMRKRPNGTENVEGKSENDYDYIDPSPYLKKRFPKPGHQSTCNGFSYYYIGMTAEEGDMTGDAEDEEESIHRSGSDHSSPLGHHKHGRHGRSVEGQEPARPAWMEKFKSKFQNMTGKFDKYKNMLSKAYRSFLPSFDVNDKSLAKISSLLEGTPLVHDLEVIAQQVAKKLREEPLGYPDEMPVHQIRRRLKKAHEFDTVTGDRLSMIDKLMDNAVEECPHFADGIVRGYGHYCEAHEDCHGITCSIDFREGFQRHIVKLDLRMDVCNGGLLMTVQNKTVKYPDPNFTDIMIVDVSVISHKELVFDIAMEESGNTHYLTLSGSLCVSSHYSCFEDTEIFWRLPLQVPQTRNCHAGVSVDPFLNRVYGMNLPDLIEEISEFGLDMTHALMVVNEIRNATLYALMTKETNEPMDGDEFPGKEDFCFESGVIPLGNLEMEIINPPVPGIVFLFMVGPIPLHLSFGANARMGVDLELGMCIMSMKAKAVVTPYIGAGVWGELAVDIGIAYGGIRLEGHLLETRFPITAEFGFGKFPINIGFKLDLVIIPLELRLKAFAKLRLIFFSVTVFDACIWKFKLPTYRINLFTIPYDKRDPNPPQISSTSTNPRQRRSSPGGCEVKQIEGRDPTDTTFLLEVSAKSDVSDIKLSYSIGTHESGTNVLGWTGMTGSSLTAPLRLAKEHHGIPLYFTVKASNSQGDETTTQCKLTTYDNSVPDGRIDESYPYTSHPHKISGNVVVFDDSELIDTHLEAVGTSQGQFGAEIVQWQTLQLKTTSERTDSTQPPQMRSFTIGKEGKLTAERISTGKTDHAEDCAQKCLNFGTKCVSFDYEYHSETCDLHSTVEGPNGDVRISGTYKHYERLGVGYSSFVEHTIDLQHGTVYILNAAVENVLGYKGYISSNGTIADHTPPEPGPIKEPSFDETRFDGCRAAITQRCIDLTNLPNHRKIIDGPGSATVFNGHVGGVDTLYTLANHFMSGNWDGFKDNETGIYGYTWSVGTTVCGTDIANFSDPHAHLSSPKFWTNTGYVRNLHLPDGPYYITVQAINNVVHGGAMVTTVCHSIPITVDTSPPIFTRGITDDDIVFDEDFNLMALYFDTLDPKSKVKNIDFGLGLTKHDVDVRGYSTYPYQENKSFIVVDDLNLASGEPVWIRLRSVNNVELFTTAHSDNPILIDRTAPVAGQVLDGEVMDEDMTYQADNTKICAQWKSFYDPESGLNEYRWGVGTKPGLDDIVEHKTFSRDQKEACSDVQLKHNMTYYSAVRAKNSALNPKMVEAFSNGVLIDTTAPVTGWIVDGNLGPGQDMQYSSETAEVAAVWGGFSDPESGVLSYTVEVYINKVLSQSFPNGLKTEFVDYSLSMKHGDHVFIRLIAKNGADVTSVVDSDGFVIDQTPPVVKYLRDTVDGRHFQPDPTFLHFQWEFDDQESGMKEYRYYVEDFHQGQGTKFYPRNVPYVTVPVINGNISANVLLSGLNLESGHKYSVKVTALNHAGMPTSLQSPGVMIDSTEPKLEKVHLGLPSVPEEKTEDNKYIEHDDQHSMTLTWRAYDFESDIVKSFVAIGMTYDDTSVTNGFKEFGPDQKAVLDGLNLKPNTDNDPVKVYYYVQVKVQNGAGMFSEVQNLSLPIKVLKDNVPGTVFDGRQDLVDSDYTIDKTSLGMSFVGFESEQCGIVGYQWAVGSQPFYYDILPFTRYGIVLVNDTHGRGQIHLQLYEGSTYYITVRAQTGHRCKEEYIVSCSDGITLDTTPPTVRMVQFGDDKIDPKSITGSLYQNRTDSLDFMWESHDASGIAENWWSVGSLPGKHDIHPVTVTKDNYIPAGTVSFKHGQTFYLNTGAQDKAGNKNTVTSPPITVDTSIPEIIDFTCTPYISVLKSLVTCQWAMIKEYESTIKNFTVGVGSSETTTDISQFHKQSIIKLSWIRDLLTRIKNNNLTAIYIIFKLENVLGMAKTVPFKVIVDRTVPIGGVVDIVTTIDIDGLIQKQDCQIPLSFVEFTVDGWKDENSFIDRYEAAIGSNGRTSNIQDFTLVEVKDKVLITDLDLQDGSAVTVTVRAYNKAGLYSQVTSDPVIVSLVPKLVVYDGTSHEDEDYQTSLNVIQGHWKYSDSCKILSAQWSVEDIAGNVLQEFTPLPSAINRFYSDVMNLTNGRTYVNIIRTVDALNRTRMSRSDGIAVKIEPPIPGDVRDGETEDLTYQESVHELYVNWDPFGDAKSRDPTQKILRYEVAIGTDRRYASTRSNIHYYIDVGLNTSHVFRNLNLTAKTVTYYMTVRGYSSAGSYQEESSNGVKVGYHDEIFPGVVEYIPVQSYTDRLYVSWSGFQADMGIDNFRVGVSTFKPLQLSNDTINCKLYDAMLPEFDTVSLHDVGVDTFTEMTNLSLVHGHEYFVTVIARDSTERCLGSYGPSLMIDTTPPEPGTLHLPGGTGPNVAYVFDPKRLEISWTEFKDPESHVRNYELKLYSGMTCSDSGEVPEEDFGDVYSVIRSEEISNDLRTEFYDLNLSPQFTYLVAVAAINGAGLKTLVRSLPVRLDITPPLPGVVKMGRDWDVDISFQSDTNTLEGMIGIAYTEEASRCPRSIQVFPESNAKIDIEKLGMDFDSECVVKTDDKLSLFVRHDDKVQHLIKGGIKLSSEKILEGNYSTVLKAAPGDQMITTWFLASSFDGILTEINFKQPENDSNVELKDIGGDNSDQDDLLTSKTYQSTSFSPTTGNEESTTNSMENSTHKGQWNVSDFFELYNMTEEPTHDPRYMYETKGMEFTTPHYQTTQNVPTTSGRQIRTKVLNRTSEDLGFGLADQYGVGLHIPGYKMEGEWYGFVWMRDKHKTISQQIKLKSDPTESYNNFIVNLEKVVTPVSTTWSIQMFLNGEVIAQFNGVGLQETGVMGIYTWNKDGYFPPVTDLLNPFIGEAVITSITVPKAKTSNMKCAHGAGFYDGESGIKELWVGVSDTKNATDNLSPMTLYKSFCNPCQADCNIGCETQCDDKRTDDFRIIDVVVSNLTLMPATVDRTKKTSDDNQLNATTYYYNILAVNYAGQETFARSKGVMVDSSPPDLQYVRCVDPSNSMEEPTEYQGTSSSMGAYWECSEDVGDIVEYRIQIGSKPGESDIKSPVSVGLTKKLEVTGLSGKLQHDHTYYFMVTVINSAGLISQDSCNVTVEILPPDVSNVTLTYMYSDDVIDDTVLTAEDKDIGLEWDGGKDDVAFYEWEIGSEPETDDVFPRIKVGITDSRKAFIRDGKLWIDETPLNAFVGEFANNSWSNDTVQQAQLNTFFVLEPGKCVYVTLYAVGRSHLSSTVRSDPLCIKRNEDQNLSLRPATDHRKRTGSKQHGEITLKDSSTGLSADIIIKGTNITILGGVLSKEDVTADYGTAASEKYKRYLIDPSTRWNDTSRFLRNRIEQYAGLMFYLSPSVSVESLREIQITAAFDATMFDTNTDLPVLMYWDNVAELWKHPRDTCDGVRDVTDFGNQKLTTKLCKDVFLKSQDDDSGRKKRSATPNIPVPRLWSLMQMTRLAPNTPPRIQTTDLYATEDTDDAHDINGSITIQYIDDEMDNVQFFIVQTMHGNANITEDGEIHYFPPKDFNGIDYVVVKVIETGLMPPFHPLSSTRNITIHVMPANDAPVILPYESTLDYEEIDVPGRGMKTVTILLEGNVTKSHDLGHVTFFDVDFVDPASNEINYTMRVTNQKLANLTFEPVSFLGIQKTKYRVRLSVDAAFNGKMTLSLRGFDKAGFTTKNMEVNVYILIAPCIHGDCLNLTSTPCNHRDRATSFENYGCQCDWGYTGQWCQTDINECNPNPCSVFYDCEDLIGYQKCNLNIVKTILLTFAVTLTLVMCFVLIRRYYKKKRPSKIDPGYNTWSFGTEYLGQQKSKAFRPPAFNIPESYDEPRPSTSKSPITTEVLPTDADINAEPTPRPSTARDINVGIDSTLPGWGTTPEGKVEETPKRIPLFSEKSMIAFDKKLEPITGSVVSQRAPHHKSFKSFKE